MTYKRGQVSISVYQLVLIGLGHLECFTDDMTKRYLEWVQTDEGKEYLVGGSKYHDPR